MPVKDLIFSDFEKEVTENENIVLLDFWAPWCGPCRMLSHTVSEIADENTALCIFKVNVDTETELVKKFGIMSIPTLISLRNGEEIARKTGAVSKAEIMSIINV